jgi:hypothetical protein
MELPGWASLEVTDLDLLEIAPPVERSAPLRYEDKYHYPVEPLVQVCVSPAMAEPQVNSLNRHYQGPYFHLKVD